MAMMNPKGRANYEPNSWGPEVGGPREDPDRGYRFFPQEVGGAKLAARSETFADHYSQARQFYLSQERIEQKHIADALVFELSKVERPDIRERMVSHLLNIDEDLASSVAQGLGLKTPQAIQALRETLDLPPSEPLSIVRRGPGRFEGRKLGVLVTDGATGAMLNALQEAVVKAKGMVEIVAPHIAGATLDDGTIVAAHQKIDGGPSVLYDAIALLVSEAGAGLLAKDAPTRDFIADAFAHCKFIAYTTEAMPLLEKAGIADALDEACIELASDGDAPKFIDAAGALRCWEREMGVDADA